MQPHKDFYERNLPHYQPRESAFFITYRLYGSIPLEKIREMSERYHLLKKMHGKIPFPQLLQLQNEYFLQFDEQLDKKLNEPYWLQEDNIAQIVYDSLLFNNKKQYDLWGFSIMPNHVHVLLSLLENSLPLYALLQKHKRYTAWQCNKILQRTAHFWQAESYDRVVRDENEFSNTLKYILNNPVKAGFVNEWTNWKWNYLNPDLKPAIENLLLNYALLPPDLLSQIRASLA